MALIDLTVTETADVVAFRANNAPEMQLAVQNFLDAADPDLAVWDTQLVGGGASPQFLCSLTVGNAEGGGEVPAFPANDLTALVIGGMDGNSVDAVAMAQSLGAIIRDVAGGVAKTQIATGGVGPHWMGMALVIE